jgi:hypothetical protein
MNIKPIKKSFESIVDAVAVYNPDKKREVKAKLKTKPKKKKARA